MMDDKSIVVWWGDPTTHKWWNDNTFTFRCTTKAKVDDKLTAKKLPSSYEWNSLASVVCMFADHTMNDENMFDIEEIKFKVEPTINTWHVNNYQTLVTFPKLMPIIREVCDWLMTNPVVDGKTIGQRRLEMMRQRLLKQRADENAAARKRADDPGFSSQEAKDIIESLRERSKNSFAYNSKRFVGRDGSEWGNSTHTLYGHCDAGNRFRLYWDGTSSRPTAARDVMRRLQEFVSRKQTQEEWENDGEVR